MGGLGGRRQLKAWRLARGLWRLRRAARTATKEAGSKGAAGQVVRAAPKMGAGAGSDSRGRCPGEDCDGATRSRLRRPGCGRDGMTGIGCAGPGRGKVARLQAWQPHAGSQGLSESTNRAGWPACSLQRRRTGFPQCRASRCRAGGSHPRSDNQFNTRLGVPCVDGAGGFAGCEGLYRPRGGCR